MEKIKQFLKNKGIGYYIVAGLVLLALITTIVFFATYNNPALDPIFHTNPMGNKASGLIPETIGIFLVAGIIVEIVVLVVPQYRFVQIIAILMFGLALYKDVLLIPDFIVGKINHVEYNGGNFGLNMFFFIMLLFIVLLSVVAVFLGFLKKEEDVKGGFIPKGVPQIAVTVVCAVAVVAAVLSSTVISNNLTKNASGGGKGQTSQTSSEIPPKKDPITDEMRAAAEEVSYEFDPTSVKIEQEEEYDFTDSRLNSLSYTATREGHNLVYVFEGEYSEGYQGQYNTYLSGMYLWDDGLFAGRSNSQNFKGFWYNSSLTAPEDDPETEEDESIDCLNMVSNDEFTVGQRTDKFFASIMTEPPMGGSSDFYERQAYIFMYPGWGDGRSVVVSGYKYYPDVAAFIDTNDNEEMKVGEKFVINSTWFFDKVIKNLKYTQIIPTSEIQWTLPDGMIDDAKRLVAAGEFEITAKWKGYSATATLKVSE